MYTMLQMDIVLTCDARCANMHEAPMPLTRLKDLFAL